jgi:hypothetical protein
MRRIRAVALVCAGPVSRGMVARLPGVVEHLGWVKAPSYRLASRAVNALRAGIPVYEYEELAAANLILISVPHEAEDGTVRELASSRLDLRNRAVVVMDTPRDSSAMRALRDRGALVATLQPIGAAEDRTLVIEGEQEAIRHMQRAMTPAASRGMQVLTPSGKSRLLAGVDEATQRFLPVVASVTDHFKAAGLSKQQSETLAQTLISSSMRAYFRAGRRAMTARAD